MRGPVFEFQRFQGRYLEEEGNKTGGWAFIARCSTTGRSGGGGKKGSPPMIRITPTTSPTNRPPVVGNVPAEAGCNFFPASEPAIAIAGMIMKKRPTNIATPPVML